MSDWHWTKEVAPEILSNVMIDSWERIMNFRDLKSLLGCQLQLLLRPLRIFDGTQWEVGFSGDQSRSGLNPGQDDSSSIKSSTRKE